MVEKCGCGQEINDKVAKFSKEVHGKFLCMKCQQGQNKKEDTKGNKEPIAKMYTKVKGKDFVTYAGALSKAHEKGLASINTEVLNIEKTDFTKGPVIVKATVILTEVTRKDKDGDIGVQRQFTGLGDATAKDPKDSKNDDISGCLVRLAETRAKARALKDAVNIGMCSLEELDSHEKVD